MATTSAFKKASLLTGAAAAALLAPASMAQTATRPGADSRGEAHLMLMSMSVGQRYTVKAVSPETDGVTCKLNGVAWSQDIRSRGPLNIIMNTRSAFYRGTKTCTYTVGAEDIPAVRDEVNAMLYNDSSLPKPHLKTLDQLTDPTQAVFTLEGFVYNKVPLVSPRGETLNLPDEFTRCTARRPDGARTAQYVNPETGRREWDLPSKDSKPGRPNLEVTCTYNTPAYVLQKMTYNAPTR